MPAPLQEISSPVTVLPLRLSNGFWRNGEPKKIDARIDMFRSFHSIWQEAGSPVGRGDQGTAEQAQRRLAMLTPESREALLLHSLEGFDPIEIARILGMTPEDVRENIYIARVEMELALRGTVLIIEDEPLTGMNLAEILDDMGHRVTGIAQTRMGALALARRERPNLILADIGLADDSSGINAVRDIHTLVGALPVIFISAFPGRILTGLQAEPAFLISKPFDEDQVRSAVSQAMFFSSTETLTG